MLTCLFSPDRQSQQGFAAVPWYLSKAVVLFVSCSTRSANSSAGRGQLLQVDLQEPAAMVATEEGGFPSTTEGVEFGWEKPVSSRKRKEESKRKTKPGSFGGITYTHLSNELHELLSP